MAMIEGHTSCASLFAMALLKSLFFAADGRVRTKSGKRCILPRPSLRHSRWSCRFIN